MSLGRPTSVALRWFEDRKVLKLRFQLERCFERRLPPSSAYLQWLIENPKLLSYRDTATGENKLWRERWHGRHGDEWRRVATEEALRLLDKHGPSGSDTQWWAFEGFTETDCCLETDKLVLVIEGKRTETLSSRTSWHGARNQLVRNVEAARELAGERTHAVLLVTENPVAALDPETVADSCPHLAPEAQAALMLGYLGQTTWQRLGDRLNVPLNQLPHTSSEVRDALLASGAEEINASR